MSYQVGSGSTAADLVDAFQAFAASQGWTINSYSRGNYLKISNGICKAVLNFTSRNVTVYSGISSGGTSGVVSDPGIIGTLCTDFAANSNLYNQQNGSPIQPNNTGAGSQAVVTYDLAGPFNQWWFFSGNPANGDPPYIHVVVQTSADRYAHFSIGLVDKKGFSHSGAAYFAGTSGLWYQDYWLDIPSVVNFNKPASQPFHFGNSSIHLYVPDALPTSNAWAKMCARSTTQPVPHTDVLDIVRTYNQSMGCFTQSGAAMLCDAIGISAPSSYSGFNVLWALPCIVENSGQICYVGDFPNVRGCNMETLTPGQEIALGSDTWKIFPSVRQSNWSNSGTDTSPSSGQYALAYKKV